MAAITTNLILYVREKTGNPSLPCRSNTCLIEFMQSQVSRLLWEKAKKIGLVLATPKTQMPS